MTLVGVVEQGFDLLDPFRGSAGQQAMHPGFDQLAHAARGAHDGRNAAVAEFHPAVGTFGIGEQPWLQHHQTDVSRGQKLDVSVEAGGGLVLDAAVMP